MTKVFVIMSVFICSFSFNVFAEEISDFKANTNIEERAQARQYKPFNYKIDNIDLIIYPVKDENPLEVIFDSKNKNSMLSHLDDLYKKNSKILSQGSYHILFVWNLDGHRMTDVWVQNMKNWSASGPLLDCYTFRDLDLTHDAGIASGDSIIVLGREEELRRKLGKESSLHEYINREKYTPEFPKGMEPRESFF